LIFCLSGTNAWNPATKGQEKCHSKGINTFPDQFLLHYLFSVIQLTSIKALGHCPDKQQEKPQAEDDMPCCMCRIHQLASSPCYFFFQAEDGIRDIYLVPEYFCVCPFVLRLPCRPPCCRSWYQHYRACQQRKESCNFEASGEGEHVKNHKSG